MTVTGILIERVCGLGSYVYFFPLHKNVEQSEKVEKINKNLFFLKIFLKGGLYVVKWKSYRRTTAIIWSCWDGHVVSEMGTSFFFAQKHLPLFSWHLLKRKKKFFFLLCFSCTATFGQQMLQIYPTFNFFLETVLIFLFEFCVIAIWHDYLE